MSPLPDQYTLKTTNNPTKDTTVYVGLVVDGVLNADFLKEKADEFVLRKWTLLRGELNRTVTPHAFTTLGENVNFKARSLEQTLAEILPYDINIDGDPEDRPSYKNFTRADEGDYSIFHFDTLSLLMPVPKSLFGIRVTVLLDATLIGFQMPHYFVDGEGMFAVVKAYSDLINDRPIPELVLPPDVNTPLSSLVTGTDSVPEAKRDTVPFLHPENNNSCDFASLVKFTGGAILGILSDKIGLAERSEMRYIHLPGKFIETLRTECQNELDQQRAKGLLDVEDSLQLTKNDVLTAWNLKSSYSHLPVGKDGPFDFLFCFNYRPWAAEPEPGTYYLHNSFYTIRVHWDSFQEFLDQPVAIVAWKIRLACYYSQQPSRVREALEYWEENATTPMALTFPNARVRYLAYSSSWTTFEFNNLDFSAAKDKDSPGSGKVVFTQPQLALPMGISLPGFPLVLKDGRGGYWIRVRNYMTNWKGHDCQKY